MLSCTFQEIIVLLECRTLSEDSVESCLSPFRASCWNLHRILYRFHSEIKCVWSHNSPLCIHHLVYQLSKAYRQYPFHCQFHYTLPIPLNYPQKSSLALSSWSLLNAGLRSQSMIAPSLTLVSQNATKKVRIWISCSWAPFHIVPTSSFPTCKHPPRWL